jgi:hypothetical protein
VKGTFRPNGLMFTPEAFQRARIEAAQSFYHRNGYVEYSMVKSWGILQPYAFLQEHCPDGMQLHSVHASQTITGEVPWSTLLTASCDGAVVLAASCCIAYSSRRLSGAASTSPMSTSPCQTQQQVLKKEQDLSAVQRAARGVL